MNILLQIVLIAYIIFLPLFPGTLNGEYQIIEMVQSGLLFLLFIKYVAIKENRKVLKEKLPRILREPASYLSIMLLLLMMVSVLQSTSIFLSLKEIFRFGLALGLYLLIILEFSTKKAIHRLIKMIYYPAFLVLLYGIFQQFTGHGVSSYVNGVTPRIDSTFGQPNLYAGYIILLFYPLFFVAMKEKSKKHKYFYFLELLLMLVSIVYTYSRNGWLSLILGCIVVSIIYNWKLLFPLIAMIIGAVAIPAVHERFNGVFANDGRVKIWKVAVKAIEEHPISGIGIGNFQPFNNEYIIQHPEFNTGENILHTHNVYLKMFAELGVVGLIVFLIFSIVIIVKAVKVARNFDGELKSIATGIGVTFFTFYLVNMFDNLLFAPKIMNYYFIFIGILVTSIINIKSNKFNS